MLQNSISHAFKELQAVLHEEKHYILTSGYIVGAMQCGLQKIVKQGPSRARQNGLADGTNFIKPLTSHLEALSRKDGSGSQV